MHSHFDLPLQRELIEHLWPLCLLHGDHAVVLRAQIDHGTVVQVDADYLCCTNIPRPHCINWLLQNIPNFPTHLKAHNRAEGKTRFEVGDRTKVS